MKKIAYFLFAFAALASCSSPADPIPLTEAEKDAAIMKSFEKYVEENPRKTWEYTNTADQMTGDSSFFAENRSENTHTFSFPYNQNGGSYLFLYLRKDKKQTLVYCQLSEGQLNLKYDGTPIRVKFDDGPVVTYNGLEPESGRSTAVFLQPEAGFIKKLKACNKVTIEVPVYDEGRRVYNFKNDGLVWNR